MCAMIIWPSQDPGVWTWHPHLRGQIFPLRVQCKRFWKGKHNNLFFPSSSVGTGPPPNTNTPPSTLHKGSSVQVSSPTRTSATKQSCLNCTLLQKTAAALKLPHQLWSQVVEPPCWMVTLLWWRKARPALPWRGILRPNQWMLVPCQMSWNWA